MTEQEKFDSKVSTQKGTFGEEITEENLDKKGFIVYQTKHIGPHKFDFVVFDLNKDAKVSIFLAEIKSQKLMVGRNNVERLTTGIDRDLFDNYKLQSEKSGLKMMMFFVDHSTGTIYGNWLHKLSEYTEINGEIFPKFPMFHKGNDPRPMVLWHYDQMQKDLYKLTTVQIDTLDSMSRSSYNGSTEDPNQIKISV